MEESKRMYDELFKKNKDLEKELEVVEQRLIKEHKEIMQDQKKKTSILVDEIMNLRWLLNMEAYDDDDDRDVLISCKNLIIIRNDWRKKIRSRN